MPYRHHSHRGKLSTLVLSTFSLPLTSCCVVYQVFLVSLTSTVGVGADFTMSLWALQCKVCWIMSSYFSDGIKSTSLVPRPCGRKTGFSSPTWLVYKANTSHGNVRSLSGLDWKTLQNCWSIFVVWCDSLLKHASLWLICDCGLMRLIILSWVTNMVWAERYKQWESSGPIVP